MKALAAEVTSTFSHHLSPSNMAVKELSGDMQHSKRELQETQVVVMDEIKSCIALLKLSSILDGLPFFSILIR
ncbi:activating signal cointegrator 1 complex subunit [Dionaea muscipula]